MIYPYIMAGGNGRRLWPLSRPHHPKPFLTINGERSLLQDSIARLVGQAYGDVSVICNQQHRFLVAHHMQECAGAQGDIILEAQPRGTGFSVALAAVKTAAHDPEALVLVSACDAFIADERALHEAIKQGAEHARQGKVVVFGAPPHAPETGYGYIRHDDAGNVLNFTEKPDAARAKDYIAQGQYLWNMGMFLFTADSMISALRQYAPDILSAAQESWKSHSRDLDFLRLPHDALAQCPDISIDYAVMENIDNAHVVPLDAEWSDVGTWKAVWAQMEKDAHGNATRGNIIAQDTRGALIIAADDKQVATLGVENLAVIVEEDSVLVADLTCAQHVAEIATRAEQNAFAPKSVWRPWGHYTILSHAPRMVVKRLTINPSAALSLQYHNHRAEHWVVVQGEIKVQKGAESLTLRADESVYIPLGVHHRMENVGAETAIVIEVQTGDYLAEDDIVRLKG